ncbi:NUDIX hydrolase [Haladaptatus sp. CMAA 1911]|uniref:NUDIX hydrolase n=1 Tax=unclassified Haladaptatus TaxID=2622732 RepID=UPI0037552481
MNGYVERLLERDEIAYERMVTSLDAGEFEMARERAESIEGAVVVAVTNDDGEVLLVQNDWMDGIGLPGGGVEPGEEWERAASREVLEETGVPVEIERPWRVTHDYFEHGDERFDGGYTVFYRAIPTEGETLATDPGVGDETIEVVGWFDDVPAESIQPALVRAVLNDEV